MPQRILELVKRTGSRVRNRVLERRLPQVFTLNDLESTGIRFEAINLVERKRITARGDEPEYIRAMVTSLRPDDVFYDVGANIGLVALPAACRCRTVAFEPDPSFLARLERNLQLNPSISMDVLPVAVSDGDGPLTLFTNGSSGPSPSLAPHGERNAVEVSGRTLDSFVASGVLPPPTVVKLDIEGAEMLALRGAKQLLDGPAAPRALFLELHDSLLPAFGSSADEVLELVRGSGYRSVRYAAKRAEQQHFILARE